MIEHIMTKHRGKLAVLFIGLALVYTDRTHAGGVLFHATSKHLGAPKYDFNEFNPGVGYIHDIDSTYTDMHLVAGTYKNSVRKQSYYAGVGWAKEVAKGLYVGIDTGLVTGYSYKVVPAVFPTIRYGIIHTSLLPIVTRTSRFDGVAVGLSFYIGD